MELIKQLQELGYSQEQAEKIVAKEKVYFQQDMDNIVSKAKSSEKERLEKNFISKTDYELLNSEYNNLKKEVKQNEILNNFKALGGNEKNFNDFMKIHNDLLETDSKNIQAVMKEKLTQSAWALANETPQLKDFGISNSENTEDSAYGTIYTNKWDNIPVK